MAPKQPCAKYQYVVTPSGPKILPVEEPSGKDEESAADYNAGGYLPVKVNDSFKNGRYRVLRKLGWGHFSTVWLVKDSQSNNHSALKVVKSAGRYAETARDEIKLLSQVSSCSPTHPGRSHIVSFLDSFSHQGLEAPHVCIVFEPLGENLLALIERHKKKGVPRALVKLIAMQMLLGLEYLHDECDLVHTDIKPENILISIPDIESHIHNELSRSPTPTSRRVGVPLPTKSRAGVSIPLTPHRTSRRQVQIFDSQPLSSPGRSAGVRGGHGSASASMSMSVNQGGSGSGSGSGANSASGSFIAQMHLARLSGGTVGHASGTAASLSSRAPKVSSTLSSSVPGPHSLESIPHPSSNSNSTNPPHATTNASITSPSTSSSSSSISSTSAAGSSSIVSTPPTSLSHSLGSAVVGLMGMAKSEHQSNASINTMPATGEKERAGLPMKGKLGKGKMGLESDLEIPVSSSWKEKMGIGASWRDKISISLSSSSKSSSSTSGNKTKRAFPHSHGHSRRESHSGMSSSVSSSWKDPGIAAPAPAVVVSACVGADGEDEGGDYFQLAGVGGASPGSSSISAGGSATTSGSSSATMTVARPSPNGTPHPMANAGSKTKSLSSSISLSKSNTAFNSLHPDGLHWNEMEGTSNSRRPTPTPNPNPSLLTQTAPSKRTNIRCSPSHHTSQLSAHIHPHPVPSDPSRNHSLTTSHTNMSSRTSHINNHKPNLPAVPLSPTSATSVTPTPTSPSPPAPPPTPNVLTPSSPSIPDHPPVLTLPPNPPVQPQPRPPPTSLNSPPPPLQTHALAPPPSFPPISIKIADLGNATPSTKHYTEDIQTRQYRAPEAILGRKDWGTRVDVWSVACVIFELLTAEYLFDPQGQGELFTKDDDHMAQIIELLGDFPLEVKMGGKYSRELFDHTGALRYIRTLKPWPLKRVMTEKYLFTDSDATSLCEFLEPMLMVDMRLREDARGMVNHKWLDLNEAEAVIEEW